MQSGFSLLETMRLEDGSVARLDRHLARMGASAAHFGFAWDDTLARTAIEDERLSHEAGCWRLRLLLDREGIATTTCTPHEETDPRTWQIALAVSPVDSANPLLRHKTTSRAIYESARAARSDVDDVVLWNEREEVTEATIANVVAEIDGVRVTPPVTCGLLPGVYRAELLENGTIHERVITKEDLSRASRIWLINSLRGWIEVQLVGGRL
jgi:branched-subunit amino acid aminotransferase/4-amino-4-deoxychorismate lyase